MQSQDYGRDAPYVVVDEQGHEITADKEQDLQKRPLIKSGNL